MGSEENISVVLRQENLRNLICRVRGVEVMLDSDLAKIYQVETKIFNRAVKRNIVRFPETYRFQLTKEEYENLRFQFGTSSHAPQNTISGDSEDSRGQSATSRGHGGRRYLPYVFTEQGVSMLSAYTKSISKPLALDLKKHNQQYPSVKIETFKDAHDRFLILDDQDVYHFGASLKDLGKKWFAFSKFDTGAVEMLKKLGGGKR